MLLSVFIQLSFIAILGLENVIVNDFYYRNYPNRDIVVEDNPHTKRFIHSVLDVKKVSPLISSPISMKTRSILGPEMISERWQDYNMYCINSIHIKFD